MHRRGVGMNGRRTRLLARTAFGRLFENDLFSSSVSASAECDVASGRACHARRDGERQPVLLLRPRADVCAELQDRILIREPGVPRGLRDGDRGARSRCSSGQPLTPDRRDALVLGPLPVSPGEQARARLLALTRFFVMFAAAVAVPTAVAFTFVTVGDSSVTEVPRRIAGHIGSTMLSAAFVFFLLINVQLILAALLGPRAVAIATVPLQAAALAGMVGALSFTPRLADALLLEQPVASAWVMWNPAAWFVGVYRWVAGDGRDVFATLAGARGARNSQRRWARGDRVSDRLCAMPAERDCRRGTTAPDGGRGAARRLWLQSAEAAALDAARTRARVVHHYHLRQQPRASISDWQLHRRWRALRPAAGWTGCQWRGDGALRLVLDSARASLLVGRRDAGRDDAAGRTRPPTGSSS